MHPRQSNPQRIFSFFFLPLVFALAVVGAPAFPTTASASVPDPSTESVESAESDDSAVTEEAAVDDAFASGITRLAGADRYDTSGVIAQRFSPDVGAAFVATGTNFPDALAAGAAAAHRDAPLLLSRTDQVPTGTLTELRRLTPDKIYVVGGQGAVSAVAERQLAEIAPVQRFGASDRYSTSLAISKGTFESASFAVIATGRNFPDALSASGVAGLRQGPVLLVDGQKQSAPASVVAELQRLGVTDVMIAGGTGVVSQGIQAQLSDQGFSVTRRGGSDRYATAAAINAAYFPSGATTAFLATGTNFPDALSGAALAGNLGSPLFITRPDCMPQVIKDQFDEVDPTSTVVLGGAGAVSDAAANRTACSTTPKPTTPTTPPAVTDPVTPGAYCKKADAGKIGYTSTGKKMVCKTSSDENRLRWRAA